jgi:uncharacterized membrane protein
MNRMAWTKQRAVKEIEMSPRSQARMAEGLPGTSRLNTLVDGVFAIVITVLVLEIKIPEIDPAHVNQELRTALIGQIPVIISYVVSFFLLGIYWIGHHAMFRMVKRYDRALIWLNILFLLFVTLMPFPVGLLIRYPDQQITLIIYCTVLIGAGLTAAAMWWHVSHSYRLISANVSPILIRLTYRRVLTAPVIYLLAILASFLSVRAAWFLLGAAILLYIVPNPLTSFHIQHIEDER